MDRREKIISYSPQMATGKIKECSLQIMCLKKDFLWTKSSLYCWKPVSAGLMNAEELHRWIQKTTADKYHIRIDHSISSNCLSLFLAAYFLLHTWMLRLFLLEQIKCSNVWIQALFTMTPKPEGSDLVVWFISVSEVQGTNSNPFPTALWIQYSGLD